MGRYIAWTDVAGRYPDAAKIAGDTAVGTYWLERAEYEIDGFLAPKYTVPFSPVPPAVQDLCVDLTYYKMTIRQEGSDKVWDYIDYRLKAILEGTLVLTTSGTTLGGAGLAWSQATGHHTSFGPDGETNWQVSSQWMQDVETERDLG